MPIAPLPQATFDPIPPDLDLHDVVAQTPNFEWVPRITLAKVRSVGQQAFEEIVSAHVIQGGKPLIIEQCDEILPRALFNAGWLERKLDKQVENIRDISNQADIPMTVGHYLRSMKQLTNQWSPTNFRNPKRQRLYLKDMDCPPEWQDHLAAVLPPSLFYMNENVTEQGGNEGSAVCFTGKIIASAGDLISNLPVEMRAQNLMCYIGHEGTYTPAHREMCASLGHNIMVEASEDSHGEKAGCSIWFMTESKDRAVVREYWLSILGHDLEVEKHFAQINAWKKANFPVYVVEQKQGDFVLVPPLAAHQVWNRGTRTMKVAWNRTTTETLELAVHEALPRARLVCRDEQYKNKAIIYYTLGEYHKRLATIEDNAVTKLLGFEEDLLCSPRTKKLMADFRFLFNLFAVILMDEMFAVKVKDVDYVLFDSNITCSYCRCNIFNRFLTCRHCVRTLATGDEDAYDVCMECYVMGRSCSCVSGLRWCEQWKWSELVGNYETWREMVIRHDGYFDLKKSPQPLEVARIRLGKKTVAQVCQESLRRRPFNDITKPTAPPQPEPEPESDREDGEGKKVKRKRKEIMGEVMRCHVCCHKELLYKMHVCTNPGCREAYCYGVLWRAFDLMPQEVMVNEHWSCPKCLRICNCGTCRRAGITTLYKPKNTILGHDTRKLADDRSIETIVDFRAHNLGWIKAMGEEERSQDSKRMRRLRTEAEIEKDL